VHDTFRQSGGSACVDNHCVVVIGDFWKLHSIPGRNRLAYINDLRIRKCSEFIRQLGSFRSAQNMCDR
jgi:hypothetical protein